MHQDLITSTQRESCLNKRGQANDSSKKSVKERKAGDGKEKEVAITEEIGKQTISPKKKKKNRNIVRRDQSVHGAIPLKISKLRTAQIVCAADIFLCSYCVWLHACYSAKAFVCCFFKLLP